MKVGFVSEANALFDGMFRQVQQGLPGHEVVRWEAGQAAPADDLEMVLVAGSFSRHEMESQPRLGLIQMMTAGYETVDEDAATDLGITLAYAESDETGNAVSVAEFTVLLMLAAARRLREVLATAPGTATPGPGWDVALQGKRVAIVGMGSIGRLVAERLHPFGMELVGTSGRPEKAPEYVEILPPDQIGKAIADADFVVLTIRADQSNENLFDAAMIDRMKHGAVLVNVARGSLVDEQALADAVRSGRLFAAGLDVTRDSGGGDSPLGGLEQIVVTPHIAWKTDVMREGTVAYLVQAVEAVASGKAPDGVVNQPHVPRLKLESSSTK